MEDVSVEVTVPRVPAEVLHRLGNVFAEQPDVDVAQGRVEDGLLVQTLDTWKYIQGVKAVAILF